MTVFQSEKQIVMNFYRRLDAAPTDQIGTILQSTVSDDYTGAAFILSTNQGRRSGCSLFLVALEGGAYINAAPDGYLFCRHEQAGRR